MSSLRNFRFQKVKEPSNFRVTPTHVYKKKSLRKAYQFLIIFACQLYGQESMETFLQSWVVMLDQLESEGKPFNWSDMLALKLKVHVSNAQSPPKDWQEYSSCSPTQLMQFVPINNSQVWVGHGHHQKPIQTLTADFFLNVDSMESSHNCQTILTPWCTR